MTVLEDVSDITIVSSVLFKQTRAQTFIKGREHRGAGLLLATRLLQMLLKLLEQQLPS